MFRRARFEHTSVFNECFLHISLVSSLSNSKCAFASKLKQDISNPNCVDMSLKDTLPSNARLSMFIHSHSLIRVVFGIGPHLLELTMTMKMLETHLLKSK